MLWFWCRHRQIQRGGEGGRGAGYSENHKRLYVSLDILVQTTLEKQLDPSGPIASRGWYVRPFPRGAIC